MSRGRIFIIIVLLMSFLTFFTPYLRGEIDYEVLEEWVLIDVNEDGSIELFYHIKILCISGIISKVYVGMPNIFFEVEIAMDDENNTLETWDASDYGSDEYKVGIELEEPVSDGETAEVNLLVEVDRMVYEDETNPGNVGLMFIPTLWSAEVRNLRVAILLPKGVNKEEVRCYPDWDNAYYDPDYGNRLLIYWERSNLDAYEQFEIGVSFPEEYVEKYYISEESWEEGGLSWEDIISFVIFVGLIVLIIMGIIYGVVKENYVSPSMSLEALGPRRGLTAVEAAYVLDFKPEEIITMVIFGLLKKRVIWIERVEPQIKIRIMPEYRDKTGTRETPLRYYEKMFLRAVRRDGTLDEEKLARTYILIRDTVENKMRGYCRKDTIEYYRKTIEKAWREVKRAVTPGEISQLYDKNLLWLLLDPEYEFKTVETFEERTFIPSSDWWWYWYIHNQTMEGRGVDVVGGSKIPKVEIPGAKLADNIVTGIERTVNNLVTDIEKFTDTILSTPPKSGGSKSSVTNPTSCVCACVSCACACACVSCACACASGGVG